MASKKLGERLIESGLITADALEKALAQQRITGHKLGDCLVEIGLLQEQMLLRFLAAEFNTRFVSMEKLSQAKIAASVLDRIPVRMAEQQLLLPIAWDSERRALSVVMAEPQNEPLVREVQLVTEAEEVFAFIALRSTIHAGIRKFYYGDPTAFSAPEASSVASARRDISALSRAYESSGLGTSPGQRSDSVRADLRGRHSRIGPASTPQLRDMLGAVRGSFGDNDYIETLNILVSMLEQRSTHLRGHSALLARQSAQVARRLALPPREVSLISIACYLHDLGKPERHFTLAANALRADWKAEAKQCSRAPLKLFESVHLPIQVNTILAQLYEAWDGSGVPQGARGDDIIIGARIIATVDSYLDLTRNPKNAHGRLLSKQEALAHLLQERGRLYDPQIVEALEKLQSGDQVKQRIECEGRVIVVAESDLSVRNALVNALLKAGLVAHGVGALDGLAEAVQKGEADLLVVGLRFGVPDLLALTQYIRSQPESSGVPIAVLGTPDPQNRAQLDQSGVNVFIPMPLDATSASETVVNLYEERIRNGGPPRPVHGTFDELPARDVLGVLAASRKWGRLAVLHEGTELGLHLEAGRVVHAWADGLTPEGALARITTDAQGDFTFDASALLSDPPTLSADLDALLRVLPQPSQPVT